MTHEQLLYKIITSGDTSVEAALRAVVELHKPIDVTLPDGEWGILCDHCDDYGVYVLYPCKTIRSIEKELK